jgi:hypothetical protein
MLTLIGRKCSAQDLSPNEVEVRTRGFGCRVWYGFKAPHCPSNLADKHLKALLQALQPCLIGGIDRFEELQVLQGRGSRRPTRRNCTGIAAACPVSRSALSVAAVNAAREEKFSAGARSSTADYLRDWTTNGRAFAYDETATDPYEDGGTAVIWGTDPEQNVGRNNPIVVGVVYPVKFKILLADNLWKWMVKEGKRSGGEEG